MRSAGARTTALRRRVQTLLGGRKEQHARFTKTYVDPLYLIGHPEVDSADAIRFVVSGAHGDPYVVELRASGQFMCSCFDARRRGPALVCKHACFVLFRVMGHEDPDFFDELRVPVERVDEYRRRLVLQGEALIDARVRHPIEADDQFLPAVPAAGAEPQDCCICYDAMTLEQHGRDGLRCCPECSTSLHLACIRRWMAAGARKTCPYCRSAAWAAFEVSNDAR